MIKNTFQVETWAICYLSDSKTQERGLKELNTKTFLGKPAPQTPLDSACAFGPRLGNRSVFIPDPRLINPNRILRLFFKKVAIFHWKSTN